MCIGQLEKILEFIWTPIYDSNMTPGNELTLGTSKSRLSTLSVGNIQNTIMISVVVI